MPIHPSTCSGNPNPTLNERHRAEVCCADLRVANITRSREVSWQQSSLANVVQDAGVLKGLNVNRKQIAGISVHMDPSAEAEAFLQGLQEATTSSTPLPGPPPIPYAGQQSSAVPVPEQANGAQTGPATVTEPPQAEAASGGRRKRNRWGPAPAEKAENGVKAVADGESKPGKKRRSRWEDVPEVNTDTTLATIIPKEIVIAGGIKVCSRDHPELSMSQEVGSAAWRVFQSHPLSCSGGDCSPATGWRRWSCHQRWWEGPHQTTQSSGGCTRS